MYQDVSPQFCLPLFYVLIFSIFVFLTLTLCVSRCFVKSTNFNNYFSNILNYNTCTISNDVKRLVSDFVICILLQKIKFKKKEKSKTSSNVNACTIMERLNCLMRYTFKYVLSVLYYLLCFIITCGHFAFTLCRSPS